MALVFDWKPKLLAAAEEEVFAAAREADIYQLGPQSLQQADVPSGELRSGRHTGGNSGVWPDISRDYFTYVPAGLDPSKPANLLVVQDARLYLADKVALPTVLDNLIAAGDLEPTVAVLAEPGDVKDQPKGSRGNRSREYDAVNDMYVRFLLGELLPEALDGLNVTADPGKRAIMGMSSGGICAFNAAWERPDQFGKVISHVGSFTNIQGGHIYPSRVRQNAKRDLRVFLQGGANDLNNAFGNWPIANHDMAAALAYRNYEFRLEFGRGGHSMDHGGAIMPQTLKWIFRK